MRTKHILVLIHIRNKGEVGTIKLVKAFQLTYFNWPFQGGASFMDPFCYLCFEFVMLSCLFIAALWSSAVKRLTSWLSCMWCFLVFLSLYHVVSWVRCETWLYRFMIFTFLLTLKILVRTPQEAIRPHSQARFLQTSVLYNMRLYNLMTKTDPDGISLIRPCF